ncbi:LOW QUALITY PROTEIN: neugrin [Lepidochelys kempii]|uniref:LOW QUALITY PROTEIN: neugrin n=1 Tax=Lepidochelys kempii TaxID=8472 RepID=UPI003C702E0C
MAAPLLPRALRAAGPSRLLARGAAGRAGPADPALQEVERVLQQQRKAVRLRRLRRELEPAGPPQRSLSWQAMEQIRYLRQAFSEEWPVARLAQGFGVSPDVIQRVLRSKFSPPLERRMKQDAKVLGKQGSREQQAGPDCRAEPGAISAGEAAGQLLPARPKDVPQPGALIAPGGPSSSSKPQRNLPLRRAGESQNRRNSQLEPLQEDGAKPGAGMEATLRRDWAPGGDPGEWDGEVLRGEELVKWAAEGWGASSRVVQRGQEYFDSLGNFLYRTPSGLARGEGESSLQPSPQPGGGKGV